MAPKSDDLWQQEAARLGGKELVAVITEMRDGLRVITRRLDATDQRHQEFLSKAFPSGDVEGHSRYHSTIIEILAEKRKLRKTIEEKTIGGLVWLSVIGIGLLIWEGFLKFLGVKLGVPH